MNNPTFEEIMLMSDEYMKASVNYVMDNTPQNMEKAQEMRLYLMAGVRLLTEAAKPKEPAVQVWPPQTSPSYHDVHIQTKQIPRKSIFDLPFNVMLTCTRLGGWELWEAGKLLAGEYDPPNAPLGCLRVDVAGHVIVDSIPKPVPPVVPSKEDAEADGAFDCYD